MSSVKKLYGAFEGSDGRIRLATLLGVSGLVIALAVLLMIPAAAGTGTATVPGGVEPGPLDDWGGGSGACDFIRSDYEELHINNPMDGVTYESADGVEVLLTVNDDDTLVGYDFVDSGFAAYQVVVNGGKKSLVFDNEAWDGPLNSDGGLHAPTKGNSQDNYYKLSHINICYGPALEISGLIYDDVDFNGTFDGDDVAEEGVTVTVSDGVTSQDQLSDSDGEYSFFLAPGTYTVCVEARDDRVQTEPTADTANETECSDSFEDRGYEISLMSGASSGNDFGSAAEVCGQTLTDPSDGVFGATIEIFASGNEESGCVDKVGALFEADSILNFPLVGGGQAAAIAKITKTFDGPDDFMPLRYDQDLTGPLSDFFEVPWCELREKGDSDGNQFDDYLANDNLYPSLLINGDVDDPVLDPGTNTPAVACLVKVEEDAEGIQFNVLLIQDDPRFR